jgi:hypothetical protein
VPSAVFFRESRLVFCNNNTIFMTLGITMNTYVHMCGNIVPAHTCDEYSILV